MVLALLPQVHRPVCEDPVLARLLLQLRPPLLPAPPPALLQLLVGRRGPGRHRGQEGGAHTTLEKSYTSTFLTNHRNTFPWSTNASGIQLCRYSNGFLGKIIIYEQKRKIPIFKGGTLRKC